MTFFRRKKFESEMDAELRAHLEAYAADLVRSGVSPQEAQRRARVEFGPVEAAKDLCRQAWGLQTVDDLGADLRLTSRTLRHNPGFTAVAILSLALGIGANTAIFGLVDAVMLRMLSVRDPGSLVFLENAGTEGPSGAPPYPCFELLRDHTTSFTGMAAFSPSSIEMVADRGREQLHGEWVSGNLYELLGVKPILGRALAASDDRIVGQGGPDGPVAVISDAFWRQRFNQDPSAIGRKVMLSGHSFAIVGIMPREGMTLTPGDVVDIALPMALSDPEMLKDSHSWWFEIVARLKPGVAVERARAESDGIFQAFMADVHPPANMRKRAFDHIELPSAAQGQDKLRERFSQPLTALLLLAGLALLAACINVANLMLARAANRRREFAVRLAIGAGRWRLVRQSLTEALVLVFAGGLLGVAIAHRGEMALASFFAEGNNQLVLNLSIDTRILLYTIAVSAITGLAFGLLPALRAARVDPAAGLQNGSRNVAGNRSGLRLGRTLVVVQVALAMVLIAGAGLFVHSLRAIESMDLGLTREGVLTMEVAPERDWFGKPEWFAMQREILDRVRRLPGVRSASWSTFSPLSGRDRGVLLDADPPAPRDPANKDAHLVSVSPEYFDNFGQHALLGRSFTPRDDAAAPKIAILNQTAARFFFGDANPIGQRLVFPRRNLPAVEVVGVINDAKEQSVRETPARFLYLPLLQSIDRINRLTLAVRISSADPLSLAAPVRREVLRAGSTLLITNVSTLEEQIAVSLLRERLVAALSVAFGGLALALTCIGIYGILAYAVTRRTNEIGIRIALGASRSGTVWMVLRESLLLAALGIVLGAPAVFFLGRAAQSLLYGVDVFDPLAVTGAAVGLLIFAAVAGFVPARRASRLEPLAALRVD